MLENSQIRFLFYNFIKNLVHERQSEKLIAGDKVSTFISTFYTFRGVYILFTMVNNYQTDFWQYEYLLCFAHTKPKLYDSLMATSVIFIGVFLHKAKMGFITSPLKIWSYFYELVVRNTDYYRLCMKSKETVRLLRSKRQKQLLGKLTDKYSWCQTFPITFRTLRGICGLKARWSVWVNLEDVNLSKMQGHSIQIYKNDAPLELRIKLALAVNVIDKICFAIQIFICE